MSLIILAILLAAGWLLLDAGYTFFAFILFVIAVMQSLGGQGAGGGAPAAVAQGQRPVIVTTTGGELPTLMKMKIKSHWHGTDAMEDIMTTIGQIIQLPLAILARILGVRFKLPPKKGGH